MSTQAELLWSWSRVFNSRCNSSACRVPSSTESRLFGMSPPRIRSRTQEFGESRQFTSVLLRQFRGGTCEMCHVFGHRCSYLSFLCEIGCGTFVDFCKFF